MEQYGAWVEHLHQEINLKAGFASEVVCPRLMHTRTVLMSSL